MKTVLVFVSILISIFSIAQTNVFIDFPPKVNGNDLELNTIVQDLNGVDMSISDFNYYLSNVRIYHDGGQEIFFVDEVFFVETENHAFYLGSHPVTTIDSMSFGIGVPKNLNHLDISQYDVGHPLSWQNPNMHWGWISGYAIMLCNGLGDSNNDGTPDAFFELHNFGDSSYAHLPAMPVIPTLGTNKVTVVIDCNLDEWLHGVNPGTVGAVHGEFPVNKAVMNNVNTRAVFTLPGNAGANNSLESDGMLSYSIAGENVSFIWNDLPKVTNFRLIDIAGKTIDEGKATEFSGTQSNQLVKSGSYFFYLLDSNGSILKHIQVIR